MDSLLHLLDSVRKELIDAAKPCEFSELAGDDLRRLDAGVHVVSGTPGRVFDMIKRRALRTRDIKMLVLDEADEMLSKGFKEQIYDVYRYLPPETQVNFDLSKGPAAALHSSRQIRPVLNFQDLILLFCLFSAVRPS